MMGMYTELLLKCRLANVDDNAKEVLQYLFGNDPKFEVPKKLPDHHFFSLPRWKSIGSCSSYYHIPEAFNYYDGGEKLFSRSDLKNYNKEIQFFLSWLKPYLDHYDNEVVAWCWYEEDVEPTLIRIKHISDDPLEDEIRREREDERIMEMLEATATKIKDK